MHLCHFTVTHAGNLLKLHKSFAEKSHTHIYVASIDVTHCSSSRNG